jgi:hypothetical protein
VLEYLHALGGRWKEEEEEDERDSDGGGRHDFESFALYCTSTVVLFCFESTFFIFD